MARGFVFRTYTADDGTTFQVAVDADHAEDTNRGWDPVVVGSDLLPRGYKPRQALGISATTGRRGSCRIGKTTAPLWVGSATTFNVEANDNTIDTMTVVALQGEYRPLSSAD